MRDSEIIPGEHMHFTRGDYHYVGRISQVESLHQKFRGSFLGFWDMHPQQGERFLMWGESLTPGGNFRILSTSEVAKIEKFDNEQIVFRTQNSLYVLVRY